MSKIKRLVSVLCLLATALLLNACCALCPTCCSDGYSSINNYQSKEVLVSSKVKDFELFQENQNDGQHSKSVSDAK